MSPKLYQLVLLALAGLVSPALAQGPGATGGSLAAGWELPQVPPAAPGANGMFETEECAALGWIGDRAFKGPTTSSALDSRSSVLLNSGAFHLREIDLNLPGINGSRLRWVRRYRSRLGRPTCTGNNWDHSFNVYLLPEAGPLATGMLLRDGNNYEHRMRPSAQNPSLLCAPGFSATLSQEQDGRWTVLFANGGTWTLLPLDGGPAAGKLERITDRNGNDIRLAYDAQGLLESLLDTLGKTTTVEHDSEGRVVSVTGPAGRQWTYGYYSDGDSAGSAGDLATVTSPAVVVAQPGNEFPLGKTTTYTYSNGFAEEDLNHNLLSITNGLGNTWLTNEYGSIKRPWQFDRLLRQTLGGPNKIIDYRYFGVVWEGTEGNPAAMTTVVNDREGYVSHHSFDGSSQLVRVERFTGRAKPKRPTTLVRNRPGSKLHDSDPDVFVTRLFWNRDNRNTLVVRPDGSMLQRIFELDVNPQADPRARGNLRELHRIAGPKGGDQQVLVDLYEYAGGHSGCCGVDFVTRHTNPKGNVTLHEYDASGNCTRTIHPVPGLVEDRQYGPRGRLVEHLHAENSAQERQRDAIVYYPDQGDHQAGRLHKVIRDVAGLALTTTYGYGPFGNVASVIDARGGAWQTTHNAMNQPVVILTREATPGGGDRGETRCWYDEANCLVRLEKKWAGADAGPLERWIKSIFDYDHLLRLSRKSTQEDGVELTGRQYSYNRNGRLASAMTGISGGESIQEVRYERDERNLLWRLIEAPGTSQETVTEQSYDAGGFLSRRVKSSAQHVWEDLIAVNDGFGRRTLSTDALSGTEVRRQFDPSGNLVLEEVRGQLEVDADAQDVVPLSRRAWIFDSLERELQVSVEHFDPSTQTAIGDGLSIRLTEWAGLALVRSVTDDKGGVTRYEHDSVERCIARIEPNGDRVDFVRDKNGNVARVDSVSNSELGGPPEMRSYVSQFDGRDRKVSQLNPVQGMRTWEYNVRGQLTSMVNERGNRILYFSDALGRGIRSEQVLTDTGDGSGDERPYRIVRSRTFDVGGRMNSSTDANQNVTSYVHDDLNNLTRLTPADGSVQQWMYEGPGLMQTVDANGTVIAHQYANGRLAARTVVHAAPGVVPTDEHYTWDGLGQLVSGSNDHSLVVIERDSMANVMRESLTIGAGDGALTGVTETTHDGLGGIKSLKYPSGRFLSYQVRHIAGQAQVTRIIEGDETLALQAWRGGSVEQRDLMLGASGQPLRSSFVLGPRGLLVSEQHTFGVQGAPLAAFDHEVNAVGNPVAYTDQVLQRSHSMTRDSVERLVRSERDRAGGVEEIKEYQMDLQGNRQRVIGGPDDGDYVMDPTMPDPADFQVNQYTSTPNDVRLYDDNGCLITRIPMQGEPLMNFFDHKGGVVQLDLGQGSSKSLWRDVLGRLIQEETIENDQPTTTSFFYDGKCLIEESRFVQSPFGGTTETSTWVWASGASAPISLRPASGQDFALVNSPAIGVVAVVDSTGEVQKRYGYEDFGTVLDAETGQALSKSALGNRFFFRGARHDLELGLILMGGGRCFEPRVGREISRAGSVSGPPVLGGIFVPNPQDRARLGSTAYCWGGEVKLCGEHPERSFGSHVFGGPVDNRSVSNLSPFGSLPPTGTPNPCDCLWGDDVKLCDEHPERSYCRHVFGGPVDNRSISNLYPLGTPSPTGPPSYDDPLPGEDVDLSNVRDGHGRLKATVERWMTPPSRRKPTGLPPDPKGQDWEVPPREHDRWPGLKVFGGPVDPTTTFSAWPPHPRSAMGNGRTSYTASGPHPWSVKLKPIEEIWEFDPYWWLEHDPVAGLNYNTSVWWQ